MASDGSNEFFMAGPPLHPFDEKWYVRGATETLGPYEGRHVKELIEQGRFGRDTPIARVGATEWTSIKDVAAFANLLAGASGGGANVVINQGFQGPGPAFGSPGIPLRYAGFWIRFLAYILDVIFVEVLVLVASVLIGVVIGLVVAGLAARSGGQPTVPDFISLIGGLVAIVMVIVYYVKFNSGGWQATPGKRLLGLHIITVSGEKVGGWLAFRRYLTYTVSALPLCIGFMVAGWNSQKKAFHDSICETRVVYGKL